MPIYKIQKSDSLEVVAVKANTKSQALNFVTSSMFTAEPMKAEEVVSFMESGGTVKDATPSDEAPVTRSADVEAMDAPADDANGGSLEDAVEANTETGE